MKTIDELGISPMPWKSYLVSEDSPECVCYSDGGGDLTYPYLMSADAMLMAAAPELYEALRKMTEVFERFRRSAWWMDANFDEITKANDVQGDAYRALKKASGEKEDDR